MLRFSAKKYTSLAKKRIKELRIAWLASGRGSGLRAAERAIESGALAARSVLLIASKETSPALAFARARRIPACALNAGDEESHLRVLRASQPDLIVLSGYLRKIGGGVLAAYAPFILNIHPALLPDFGGKGLYGRRVHEAVLAAGKKQTGASIHIVTAEYDRGPVIAQKRLNIAPQEPVEKLEARVMALEQKLLTGTLAALAAGKIDLRAIYAGWQKDASKKGQRASTLCRALSKFFPPRKN